MGCRWPMARPLLFSATRADVRRNCYRFCSIPPTLFCSAIKQTIQIRWPALVRAFCRRSLRDLLPWCWWHARVTSAIRQIGYCARWCPFVERWSQLALQRRLRCFVGRACDRDRRQSRDGHTCRTKTNDGGVAMAVVRVVVNAAQMAPDSKASSVSHSASTDLFTSTAARLNNTTIEDIVQRSGTNVIRKKGTRHGTLPFASPVRGSIVS